METMLDQSTAAAMEREEASSAKVEVKLNLVSGKRPRNSARGVGLGLADEVEDDDNREAKKQFVTAVENSKIDVIGGEEEKELVIPLIPRAAPLPIGTRLQATAESSGALASKTSLTLEERAAKELLRAARGEGERANGDDDENADDSLPKLVIGPQGDDTISHKGTLLEDLSNRLRNAVNDDERFAIDMQSRADDITAKSEQYAKIPVEKFGAALLRGMGWTGDQSKGNNANPGIQARPARLGLGASDVLRKATQLQTRPGPSVTSIPITSAAANGLFFGDIVLLSTAADDSILRKVKPRPDRRDGVYAKVIATKGVAGLNKIRVQLEDSSEIVDIASKIAIRSTAQQLEEDKPHFPVLRSSEEANDSTNKGHRDEHGKDQEKQSDGKDRGREKDKKTHRESKETKSKYEEDKHHHQKSSSDQKGNSTNATDRESPRLMRWVRPGIRVKLVSKRYGNDVYLRKGTVLDVPSMGVATVKVDSLGSILTDVAERHLETVLPRAGQPCVVLAGEHKGELATFVSLGKHKATIQCVESLEIVEIDPDWIAEGDNRYT